MQKTQNAREEVVFISVDENFICRRLSGPSREDAIEEHDRDAVTWYASDEYEAETQCFDNACMLAIPRKDLKTDQIDGEHLTELADGVIDEIREKYIVHYAGAIQPLAPACTHNYHKFVTHTPTVGSGGGVRGADRCSRCDLVKEWDDWKTNKANGEHYVWMGYRRLTDEEKESISLEA